jgi:glycosyltransferase involved in cell wall biosynthesis
MKLLLSIIVIIGLCSIPCAYAKKYAQDLVVSIMIKNEEGVIAKTLEPFIKAGIYYFSVFDTGSTDNTIQEIQDLFAQHPQVVGFIDQEEFVNFEVSRNRGLELARQHFPDSGFLLMIDAEFYVENAELLLPFCHKELRHKITSRCPTAYYVQVDVGSYVLSQVRLLRTEGNDKWVGKIHEVIVSDRLAVGPDKVVFHYKPEKRALKVICRYTWDKGIY